MNFIRDGLILTVVDFDSTSFDGISLPGVIEWYNRTQAAVEIR